MGRALEIIRMDHTAADLRTAASKSSGAAQVRRLLAIACWTATPAGKQRSRPAWTDKPCGTGC